MAGWLDSNILSEGARATLDTIVGGALCLVPQDLSILHYLFLVASTGGGERLISIKADTFDNSPPDGGRGVLYGLIEGSAARSWGPHPMAQRTPAVPEAFATCFGPQAYEPTDYLERDWASMPWIRGGASAAFAPGTWTGFGSALRVPVERIHWAGTETAIEQSGSMEGAISAAGRAVNEILH